MLEVHLQPGTYPVRFPVNHPISSPVNHQILIRWPQGELSGGGGEEGPGLSSTAQQSIYLGDLKTGKYGRDGKQILSKVPATSNIKIIWEASRTSSPMGVALLLDVFWHSSMILEVRLLPGPLCLSLSISVYLLLCTYQSIRQSISGQETWSHTPLPRGFFPARSSSLMS